MCLDVCSEFRGVYVCETRCVMSESDKIHACRDACQASFSASCDRVSCYERWAPPPLSFNLAGNGGIRSRRWSDAFIRFAHVHAGISHLRTQCSRRLRILHELHAAHVHGHLQALHVISLRLFLPACPWNAIKYSCVDPLPEPSLPHPISSRGEYSLPTGVDGFVRIRRRRAHVHVLSKPLQDEMAEEDPFVDDGLEDEEDGTPVPQEGLVYAYH